MKGEGRQTKTGNSSSLSHTGFPSTATKQKTTAKERERRRGNEGQTEEKEGAHVGRSSTHGNVLLIAIRASSSDIMGDVDRVGEPLNKAMA